MDENYFYMGYFNRVIIFILSIKGFVVFIIESSEIFCNYHMTLKLNNSILLLSERKKC